MRDEPTGPTSLGATPRIPAPMSEELPRAFCWTRYGSVESGMTLEEILEEKNEQREQSGGRFLWVIGNSVGKRVAKLVDEVGEPEVVFSPQRNDPKEKDRNPKYRLAWTSATDAVTGEAYKVPLGPLPKSGSKGPEPTVPRYALVCRSERPIEFNPNGAPRLDFRALRPLTGSAEQVARQDITTAVRREDAPPSGDDYDVTFRATLVKPYVVLLHEPRVVSGPSAEPQTLRVRLIDHRTIPPHETTIEASKVDVRPDGISVSDLQLRAKYYSRDDWQAVIG